MTKVNDNHFQLAWEDNFSKNGRIHRDMWDFDIGDNGWGNQQVQYYTQREENSRYENGHLKIETLREDYEGKRFTSARLKSKASWTYGRLQVKAKFPAGKGLWSRIWMLPKARSYSDYYWPDNGEINIAQQVGYDPHRIFSGVQTQCLNSVKDTQPINSVLVPDCCDNFKVYTLNWNQETIEMFVGDERDPFATRVFIWEKQNKSWEKWPFDQDFFLIVNLSVGGTWGGIHGIDETIFPKRLELEWIRFYKNTTISSDPSRSLKIEQSIALRAKANEKFVSADNAGNSPLIADRDSASTWETFDVIRIDENRVALKSHANGLYVSIKDNGNGPLIANANSIDKWEAFTMIYRGKGKVAFLAVNNKYVSVADDDDDGKNSLTVNRDSAKQWETFDVIPR